MCKWIRQEMKQRRLQIGPTRHAGGAAGSLPPSCAEAECPEADDGAAAPLCVSPARPAARDLGTRDWSTGRLLERSYVLNTSRPANPYSPQPNPATLSPARRLSPVIPAPSHTPRVTPATVTGSPMALLETTLLYPEARYSPMLPASGDEMRTALPPGKSTHEGDAILATVNLSRRPRVRRAESRQ